MQITVDELVARVAASRTWNERVEEIRRVPELFGQAQHSGAYAAIAAALYRPHLAAQFAYVQWKPTYEVGAVQTAYDDAVRLTQNFSLVEPENLEFALLESPRTLRIFRLVVGYTTTEFAVAASQAALRIGALAVTKGRVEAMEDGAATSVGIAQACAEAIHLLVTGQMWDVATGDFRSKIEKPDTANGWATVQQFARDGVPYSLFLHQRHYGGPFRTLLDATSTVRGDILEIPLEELLLREGIPFIRTGSQNQAEIAQRFGLTVRPAPDFVIFEGTRTLRAIIECSRQTMVALRETRRAASVPWQVKQAAWAAYLYAPSSTV